jgi:hypothetical protein
VKRRIASLLAEHQRRTANRVAEMLSNFTCSAFNASV